MSTIPQPTAGATGRIARASVLVDLAAPLDRSPPSQTSMSLAVAASSAVAARVSAKTSASVRGGNLRRSARVPARRVMASAARAEVNILKDEDKKSFVDSVETFIFDCDGVIWKGDSLIEGVPETIAMLRAMGKRLIFVTNNSTCQVPRGLPPRSSSASASRSPPRKSSPHLLRRRRLPRVHRFPQG